MIKRSFPNKSVNPESLKNNHGSLKVLQLTWIKFASICWEGSQKKKLFTISCFKWSVQKNCAAKILLAIWEKFLEENNCNYNSYKLKYNCCSFVGSKTRIKFSRSWWSGNEKCFCLMFIVRPYLFRSHDEFSILLFLFGFSFTNIQDLQDEGEGEGYRF